MRQYISVLEFAREQTVKRFDGPACILISSAYVAEGIRFDVRMTYGGGGKLVLHYSPVTGEHSSIPSLSGLFPTFFTE